GLMQIMPMTSEEICGNLSEDIESMDMSDPETNIKYGVYYIKQLLDKYEGNVEVALAAYNAGMGNVKNWLESTINIEDFTNNVNINETKNYISKVNKGRDMYKLLYDDLKIQSLFNGDNNIKIMNDIKALLKDVKTKVGQLM
ncbi:MAG: lytic transglycosylase domain-containing protein, partial [Tissierellia bacterium]|nr:lytic transglycosylase domain-containing protein [Tissierellia bacterium]